MTVSNVLPPSKDEVDDSVIFDYFYELWNFGTVQDCSWLWIETNFRIFKKIGIWSIRFIINISQPESFHLVIFCRKSAILVKVIGTKSFFWYLVARLFFRKFLGRLFLAKMTILDNLAYFTRTSRDLLLEIFYYKV